MKRSKIWISLTAMLAAVLGLSVVLVGCGGNGDATLSAVTIANKTALTAAWTVGGSARTVEVRLTPDSFTTDNTEVTVTSSDTSVITVDGFTLSAVGAGEAVITAAAGELRDTVTITVTAAGETPELTGVSITNKTALTAAWKVGEADRTLEVAFSPDSFTTDNTEVVVTSSNTDAVTVDGFTLTAVAPGTATITASAGGFSDTVTVTVSPDVIEAPEIVIEDDLTSVNMYEQTATALPEVTATSFDGNDLSAYIEVTLSSDEKMSYEDGELEVTEKGSYTVTYTVADPRDESQTDSVTLTVNAYRKVFGAVDGTHPGSAAVNMVNGFAADAEQTAQVTDQNAPKSDWVFAQFNMEGSTQYYAEVTFEIDIPQQNEDGSYENDYNAGDMNIGLGHSVAGDATRWLASMVDRRDRNFKIKDMDLINDLDWSNLDQSTSVTPVIYSFQLANYRGINDTVAETVKFAVARDGDFFYVFINDEYVDGVTMEYYRENDTVPGICMFRGAETLITDISYYGGAEAKAKTDSLLGSNIAKLYVPADWAIDSKNPDNITLGETTAEKGANFTFNSTDRHGNNSMVSPYLYFDGDFTFEWEYRNTGYNEGMGEPRMWIDLRLQDYSETWIQFGAEYRPGTADSPQTRVFANRMDAASTIGYQEGCHWFDGKDGVDDYGAKFSVTRRIRTDGDGEKYAEYTFSVTPYADADKTLQGTTFTRTLVFDGTFTAYGTPYNINPAGIVQIVWHNQGVSGEYSNIRWFVPPEADEVEITNADELTAAWTAGADSRTIELAISPDEYLNVYNTPFTVTSDRPDVVSVNGLTLSAVGVGTANVTVTVGSVSDTVTITVTTPPLESISIANKEALAASWTLGTGTRTVEVAFHPGDYYNAQNTQVTVSSGNTEAITVDGMTLTAVGTGKSLITVTAGGKTDTVEITVVPEPTPPVLTIDGNAESIDVYEDTAAALPGYTATSYDGTDLTELVEITVSDESHMSVEDGMLTVSERSGTYTVTYSVVDPTDGALTNQKTLTVNVYRKVFGAVAGTHDNAAVNMVNGFAADAEQTAQVTDQNAPKSDWVFAQFNMEGNTQYYAEVTFEIDIPQQTGDGTYENDYNAGDMNIGLGHSVAGDATRWLASVVDRRDRNFKIKDMNLSESGWDNLDQNSCATPVIYSFQLANYRGINDTADETVKFAVARDGDFFYVFINDEYVDGLTLEYYRNNDTVPGICMFRGAETLITDIVYYAGETAKTKTDSLLGSNIAKAYVPFDWAAESKDPTNFTLGETTAEKGANFTFNRTDRHENNSMISPYLYFDGDFTFEWEYRNTGYNETNPSDSTGWEPRMFIDIRPRDYSETWIQFGAEYRPGTAESPQTRVFANRMDAASTIGYQEGCHWFDGKDGVDDYGAKFSVTRRIKTDGDGEKYAEYTFSVIPYADENKTPQETTFTRTIEFDGTFTAYGTPYNIDPAGIVQIVWHNRGVSGEYSNINWFIPEPEA